MCDSTGHAISSEAGRRPLLLPLDTEREVLIKKKKSIHISGTEQDAELEWNAWPPRTDLGRHLHADSTCSGLAPDKPMSLELT